MNKIFYYLFICFGVVSLFSCNNNSTKEPTPEKTPTPEVSYSKNAESNLEENVDFISHAATFDGNKFSYDQSKWYMNNLDKVPLPDPHIYYEDGVFYIVGTCDMSTDIIACYTTLDFNTFEYAGEIYNPKKYGGWENSRPQIYAPEMYCFDGVYYLYYSALTKASVRENSVVYATSPLGPYKPIVNDEVDGLNNPLFLDKNDRNAVLDSTIFVDDDNTMYMYYSVADKNGQHVVGVKLINPYIADFETYTELVKPGYLDSTFTNKGLEWEEYREKNSIVEAPYMIKSEDKYYLTYSVNGCWNKYYNVCYAVSDSPLGNFTKPYEEGKTWTNLLLGYPGDKDDMSLIYLQWSGFASGTGHHCFFNVGNEVMIGYHAHQNRDWNSDSAYTRRYVAIDYLHFDKDGVPFVNGPTWSVQPLPEGISGYKNIALNATIKSQNVTDVEYVNDNYIEDCYNLVEGTPKEVSLGSGYSYIELIFDKEYEIGGIAIYNSAFYEKMIEEVAYIDFDNGNAVIYPQYCVEKYVDYDLEFIQPGSAITVEFNKSFTASRVVICFKTSSPANINEIKVLGK